MRRNLHSRALARDFQVVVVVVVMVCGGDGGIEEDADGFWGCGEEWEDVRLDVLYVIPVARMHARQRNMEREEKGKLQTLYIIHNNSPSN